jgi:putative phosphoesterase
MKILVFSDSHSRSKKLLEAISLHNGICDAVIFLGDGIKDLDALSLKYPNIPIIKVKGNCDIFGVSDTLDEVVLDFDGIKVLLTHGHKHGVKYGYGSILQYAYEKDVDAVMFGHTHIPCERTEYIGEKRIQLFNPGSIATENTYGIVNTSNGVLITSVGKI